MDKIQIAELFINEFQYNIIYSLSPIKYLKIFEDIILERENTENILIFKSFLFRKLLLVAGVAELNSQAYIWHETRYAGKCVSFLHRQIKYVSLAIILCIFHTEFRRVLFARRLPFCAAYYFRNYCKEVRFIITHFFSNEKIPVTKYIPHS